MFENYYLTSNLLGMAFAMNIPREEFAECVSVYKRK